MDLWVLAVVCTDMNGFPTLVLGICMVIVGRNPTICTDNIVSKQIFFSCTKPHHTKPPVFQACPSTMHPCGLW